MSKKALVEGEVVLRNGKQKEIEFYETEFILSDDVKDIGHARIIVQGALITDYLRKTMKNFHRVRTCDVTDLIPTKEKPENDEMQLLLIEATKLQCVPENIDNYKRQDFKAKALKAAIEKAKERRTKAVKKDNVKDMGYVD